MRRTDIARLAVLLITMTMSCLAAEWQATAAAGFGMYRSVPFTTSAGSAQAGLGPRYALAPRVARELGERFALEAGYTFQDGDFEISSGGRKTAFDANTHALHGDLIAYLRQRSTRLRPYLEAGAGVKFYHGVEQPAPRPLGEFASFRRGVDARALLAFGGGLEWQFASHWAFRVDVRDETTPFPKSVIVPASGATLGGWLHDLVPTIGFTIR